MRLAILDPCYVNRANFGKEGKYARELMQRAPDFYPGRMLAHVSCALAEDVMKYFRHPSTAPLQHLIL
jgi:hypothetical protein